MRKLLLLCLVAVTGSIAAAAQEISVDCVDQGGRLLAPVRSIVERLGGTVEWFADSNSIHITSGDKIIVIAVGETEASINDEPVTMDVPARNQNGHVLVPVRFLAEALGQVADYQGDRVVLGGPTAEDIVLLIASRLVLPTPRLRGGGGPAVGSSGGCSSCGH